MHVLKQSSVLSWVRQGKQFPIPCMKLADFAGYTVYRMTELLESLKNFPKEKKFYQK